jgi:hypothetical protein
MVCGTFTMNSVAAADVAAVVAGFQANNPPPTSVTKTQNADGTYTVVAQFPPCPADTTHATGS